MTADLIDEPFRAVLLLGDEGDHASNITLLRDEDRFAPFRVTTPAGLDAVDLDDVCAVIVAQSWWRNFDPVDQRHALEFICDMSSLLMVRIDVRGLAEGARELIEGLCDRASSYDRLPNSFSCSETSQLTGTDLIIMGQHADALCKSKTFFVEPAGLSRRQTKLLRYAVVRQLGGRRRRGYHGVSSVEIGAPPMGRSGNKTLIVYPEQGESPFVVRIGSCSVLRSEFLRIRELVTPFDHWVQPTMHFDGKDAAIVYEVIPDPDNEEKPAPTLAARFREWDSEQLPFAPGNGPDLGALRTCIKRAFSRLAKMNSRKAPEHHGYGYGWIVENLVELEKHGVKFRFDGKEGKELTATTVVAAAYQVVKLAEKLSCSHGDVNLDNVLVRDDREPVLIDYQLCGAGHPIYDIWYLAAAIVCGFLRPIVSEEDLADSISMALTPSCELDHLINAFPLLMACQCNCFCMEALIIARDTAYELLQHYELPPMHFFSVAAMVAGYALSTRSVQVIVARSLLRAVASEIVFATASLSEVV